MLANFSAMSFWEMFARSLAKLLAYLVILVLGWAAYEAHRFLGEMSFDPTYGLADAVRAVFTSPVVL